MDWFIEYNIVFFIVSLLSYLLIRNRGSHRINRWLFLSLPFIFFGLSFLQPIFESAQSVALVVLPAVEIGGTEEVAASALSFTLMIYIAGMIISLLTTLYAFYTIIRLKSKSTKETSDGKTVYIGSTTASFFKIVFLNEKLSKEERELAYAHEKAHVDQKHSIDRLIISLIQSLLWFNPGIYLWKQMIVENHEYLADEEVLKKQDKKLYGSFLLNQEMQSHQPALHLTSNMSNLKSRIMKMNQRKKSAVFAYFVIPAMAVASLSFTYLTPNDNSVEIVQSQISEEPIENPDKFPEFQGGNKEMMKYLSNEIKYPKAAAKANSQGKVMVSMVITKEGEVSKVTAIKSPDKLLSKEAVRVVSKMPNWSPGEKDGKKVSVKVILPIMFKLNTK